MSSSHFVLASTASLSCVHQTAANFWGSRWAGRTNKEDGSEPMTLTWDCHRAVTDTRSPKSTWNQVLKKVTSLPWTFDAWGYEAAAKMLARHAGKEVWTLHEWVTPSDHHGRWDTYKGRPSPKVLTARPLAFLNQRHPEQPHWWSPSSAHTTGDSKPKFWMLGCFLPHRHPPGDQGSPPGQPLWVLVGCHSSRWDPLFQHETLSPYIMKTCYSLHFLEL